MVDHTIVVVPLANVYLDSPYYKGHCRVMCVSSPVYPVIIGNVRGPTRTVKSAPKKRDSKKKPAQLKGNDNRARRSMKIKEGATEDKCVAGPVVTRAQAKKSDKVHPLKVKELCPVLTSRLLKIFKEGFNSEEVF